MEKLLQQTNSDNGFKYLYWTRYGNLDWQEAKEKAVYKAEVDYLRGNSVPREFITGPDDTGRLDFVSDIQGEFSRYYP
jgi:hypothetical protein